MAEEIAEQRVVSDLGYVRRSRAFITDRRTVIALLTAGFFLVTFIVYWKTGPQDSPYVHHVNQANAFLHGRLDIDQKYAKNANLLERAVEDDQIEKVKQGQTLPPCGEITCYLTHPPAPALLLLPLVAISGLNVNQALVSVVLGALTAPLVYRVTRALTNSIPAQVLYTGLFMFGTIFWFTAAHGGVWFFSHSLAALFLFVAVYAALVPKNAALAGAGLGAAFLTRNDSAWAIIFLLIMFCGPKLIGEKEPASAPAHDSNSKALLPRLADRVNLRALVLLMIGTLPFVAFSFWFNYARFENPFDSGYTHSVQVYEPGLSHLYVDNKLFDTSYIQRHIPVFFGAMPIFKADPPYIIPWGGAMAIWATTPAFLYALFVGIKDRRVIAALGIALAAATTAILWTAASQGWDLGPLDVDLTDTWVDKWQFYPFWIGIVIAIAAALRLALRDRDLLPLACWATIVPIALTNFLFAATGYTQFGYRYGIEFYPFLFILTVRGMGSQLKWHTTLVILISVIVNLWAMLWIYEFGADMTNGWTWYEFF